ncbi:MAG TPA: bifunctional UDP-N-acetylmuramoyl-tripeptide:D-alanyl-D-alanine ligase/alanine racemase [Chitinophagaceae bacterium]|nr:bifunctional UDP-N-acetylmuramoyl-tripeptide:D-alanyl-D-alanine ligase/alanine racemase [Chitinophagaceae bacterium]
MYKVSQIASIIRAQYPAVKTDADIEHILLDSRKLLFPASSVFFALNGPRRTGSSFITELYQKGVRCFVVDESFEEPSARKFSKAVFLQVPDVLQALQQLAAYHRQQFSLPVIGITGSNGKTIVKEWLYQLLQPDHNIVRSPKSFNSQVGVPLSVWQISNENTLGIFEAGISQPGEMQQLAKIIEPQIGIVTSIGEAHSEGFLNIRQKINEKLRLFVKSDVLIYCADNPDLNEAVNTFKNNVRSGDGFKLFSWSKKETATLQVTGVDKNETQTTITARFNDAGIAFSIPFTDEASVENAITCCCVLLQLGYGADQIASRMPQLRHVEMRLELKQGINNCSVINDSYNSDINSLVIALDFLQQQQQHARRTLILSDIMQSGKSSGELYADVAAILEQKNINRFIGIGPELARQRNAFKNIEQTAFYGSTADFIHQFHAQHFYDETVLLKGARFFEFELISHLLEQKAHQTVLEINLNAVTHNLKTYQQLLNPGVKLMAMVKAFSYGSGSFEIANLLQFHQVDYLAVAYADEGVELRKAGISLPIMVMNAEEITFDVMMQYNLEPELFSFGILDAFEDYIRQSGIHNYPVHIKIDTGMRRLGFEEADIKQLCERLKSTTLFKVQSVFSHLAASDSEAHDAFTESQAGLFLKACKEIQKATGYKFIRHIANTSAIHRHQELQLDMVRLGIGLYGVDSHEAIQQQLRNVTTLKSTVSQIKHVKAGERVGYSRKGVAVNDSTIATIRIGYADGYPRLMSNGVGKMWIRGKRVPVIGNVCMDMTMLDITGAHVQEGDEVIVFGQELPVAEVAAWAQTIPYEILTGISQRVKRVYFEE